MSHALYGTSVIITTKIPAALTKSAVEMSFLLWTLERQQSFKLCCMWSYYMYNKHPWLQWFLVLIFTSLKAPTVVCSHKWRWRYQPPNSVFTHFSKSSPRYRNDYILSKFPWFVSSTYKVVGKLKKGELISFFFPFSDSKGFPPWDVGKRSWPYCEHSQFSWSRRCQRPCRLLC